MVVADIVSFWEHARADNLKRHEFGVYWEKSNFNNATVSCPYPYSKSDPTKRLTKTADIIHIRAVNLHITHAGAGGVVFELPNVWHWTIPYAAPGYDRIVLEPWTSNAETYDATTWFLGVSLVPSAVDANPPICVELGTISNYNAGDDVFVTVWGWYEEDTPSESTDATVLTPDPTPVSIEKANIWPWKR